MPYFDLLHVIPVGTVHGTRQETARKVVTPERKYAVADHIPNLFIVGSTSAHFKSSLKFTTSPQQECPRDCGLYTAWQITHVL
jgi:hypothetical protein